MQFHDLRSFLTELERADELIRVGPELSAKHEAAAAIKMLAQKSGKAVLLDKIAGYTVPVVGNLLGSFRRLAIAMGVPEKDIASAYLEGRDRPVKPSVIARGPIHEVVIERDIDILKTMPVLVHHEKDAGPYMTSAFVVARDPATGLHGLGIHRIQVKSRDAVRILLASPPLSDMLMRAERENRSMEIAIVIGADPIMYFTSPQVATDGADKYDIAGGLAKEPIDLVRCKSVDIDVPAYAEFVLEGRITPGKREIDGPFGESTGYYLTYNSPVARIEVITHRRNPIYHTLVPFASEEKVLGLTRYQVDTFAWLQSIMPGVRQVYCPTPGVTYVQIEKRSDGDASRVIEALFPKTGSGYSKIVVVFDTDIDILNPNEVAWALSSRVQPDRNVVIQSGLPGQLIDPSASVIEVAGKPLRTLTAKLGIDATKPLGQPGRYEKIDVPPEVKAKVARLLGI